MINQNVNALTEECLWCRGSGRVAAGMDCGPCLGTGRRPRRAEAAADDTQRQGARDRGEQMRPSALVVLIIVVRARR